MGTPRGAGEDDKCDGVLEDVGGLLVRRGFVAGVGAAAAYSDRMWPPLRRTKLTGWAHLPAGESEVLSGRCG